VSPEPRTRVVEEAHPVGADHLGDDSDLVDAFDVVVDGRPD
jgi:hypothetical protein